MMLHISMLYQRPPAHRYPAQQVGIDELAVKPVRYQILYGKSSSDENLQTLDFTVK